MIFLSVEELIEAEKHNHAKKDRFGMRTNGGEGKACEDWRREGEEEADKKGCFSVKESFEEKVGKDESEKRKKKRDKLQGKKVRAEEKKERNG